MSCVGVVGVGWQYLKLFSVLGMILDSIWWWWLQACVAATRWGVQRCVCHAYSQAWWWECHRLRLHECCRCWRVIFHWGKHELQHVLWNTAAEHDPLPPETGSQGSVLAWQWLQTHLQDDHYFTEEAEGKAAQWNIFGGSSSGRWRCAKSQISASSTTSSCRSGRAFQWLPVKF